MSVLIGGPNGRLAFMLNSLSSLNIEIIIIIMCMHACMHAYVCVYACVRVCVCMCVSG